MPPVPPGHAAGAPSCGIGRGPDLLLTDGSGLIQQVKHGWRQGRHRRGPAVQTRTRTLSLSHLAALAAAARPSESARCLAVLWLFRCQCRCCSPPACIWNPIHLYRIGQNRMYRYVLVHTSTYQYMPVQDCLKCTYRYVQVYTINKT